MAGMPVIEAESLVKRYGKIEALRGVSFTVGRGEVLGFLGPNGAGKTSTMRILTCFFPATRGTARVNGFDVATQQMDVRRSIGYLPEAAAMYGEMRVADYLGFVANLKGVARGERPHEVRRVMRACALEDVRQRPIRNLSKGYRQRVGLAQALVGDPPVLILDEPTVGLDPGQIKEIRTLIHELAGERTILLSSHILPEVGALCQRVLVINQGAIVADGSPDELARGFQQQSRVLVRVAGDGTGLREALAAAPGVTGVDVTREGGSTQARVHGGAEADPRPALARAVIQGGWDLLELNQAQLSLEDIYVQLVTQEAGENDPRAGA